jgi:hypothetical protein
MANVIDSSAPPIWPLQEEERVNCCSQLLYTWLSPLFVKAAQKAKEQDAISQEDLCGLPSKDHASTLAAIFQESWDKNSVLAMSKFQLNKGKSVFSGAKRSTNHPTTDSNISLPPPAPPPQA